MEIKDYTNIHQMLKETSETYNTKKAYSWFIEAGITESVTWVQFYEQVKKVSKSLMTLGVGKNDKVNILSYSSYKWVLSDLGIVCIGACSVGIYHSNLAKDCQYIIDHSDAKIVFAQDETQLEKLFQIRNEIPKVEKVVLFSGDAGDDDWVITFDDFLELGNNVSDEDFMAMVDAVAPEDPAGIIYTSGTTGVPKGAVLTNDNVTFTAQSVFHSANIIDGHETFLFLPLAHVFAKTCVFTALYCGVPTTFARDITTVIDDIKVARPHWFASVPRIYEKVYSKVISGAEAKGGAALKIFNWACKTGALVGEYKLKKQEVPFMLGLKYKLASKLVFSKIQAALGGRVQWAISGAAPLDQSIGKFFHAAGILLLEGIGMTENTSFTNLNRFDNYRFGWVGQPGVNIEQKITDDGEIMYRGRNVMKEYYKMPEKTAETLTEDGWQYTGDLGEIDSENFLRITGRKKDLIITAGGKNIAPSSIEGVIATSKYISQICVVGDKKKFLSAVISLDPDTVPEYAKNNNISFKTLDDLMVNPEIISLIEAQVEEKNKNFASFESIKKITLVQESTIENGLLTPTMKLKKSLILDKYKDEIDAMY
ncbi:MAG: long-chain fatty acid--CoA ligase [Desulfobacterales bacterium]|nr:long-chain fatty acid--CoA ligase [Desulfobacterales bacterium]